MVPERMSPDSHEGMMSNSGFATWIRHEVHRRLGREEPGTDKTKLFMLLHEEQGDAAVFDVGYSIRELPMNPVIQALLSASTPSGILERWMRLEKMSHTHNRTRVVESSTSRFLLEHYALQRRQVHELHHLFVWGLLVGLFERSAFHAFSLRSGRCPEIQVYENVGQRKLNAEAGRSALMWFEWRGDCASSVPNEAAAQDEEGDGSTSVLRLLNTDLAYPWRISEVAKRMGMSSRALQRVLQAEKTSFSKRVMEARLNGAQTLLARRDLSLTEIAFCTGFSDLAHFSRAVKEHFLIGPSELRLLMASE